MWSLRSNRRAAQTQTAVSLAQVDLLDKTIALLAARDPLGFQQIQAMNGVLQYDEPYDPSDEAEIRRMRARDGQQGDELNEHESGILSDILGPGISGLPG